MTDRILIIQTAFLGDVILSLPLLQILKKKYPSSGLDFLCIPGTAQLLKNNPYVNEVIVYDKRKSGAAGLYSLIRILRKKKYDLIISPHRSFRTAIISKLTFPKKSITFDKSSLNFLYDEKVRYESSLHEIQRNLKLLTPLGIYENNIVRPELFPGNEEIEIVNKFLSGSNIRVNDRFMTIAPGSVWFTKRFPKEKFVKVCDLLENDNVKIVLIGGESDNNLCEYILNSSLNKNIINASGKLSVLDSAELIRRSSLLITNDSAPLHIANAVGTDVIAVFGATIPGFGFYPYGQRDVIIETLGLNCRPCSIHGGNECPVKTFRCMNEIDEKKIFESVRFLLKSD